MKKMNRKMYVVLSVAMIGAMTCMSGCSSSNASETQVENRQVETQQQLETEVETKIDQETTPSTQEESIELQAESTSEETEAVSTETEAETETKVETETKIEAENQADEQAEPASEAAPAAEGSVAAGDFAIVVKGVTIPLGSDMRDYTALLGDPDAYSAAKSCTEAGDDKVYTYGGVDIYTYITNGADIVTLIEITGTEALPSGIRIGSTKQDVIAAYGSSYIEDGTELLYEMGNKTIGLQMNGETVSFMELF